MGGTTAGMALDRIGPMAGSAERLGTVIVEAGESIEGLTQNLAPAMFGPSAGRHRVVIACRRGREQWLADRLPECFRGVAIAAIETWPTDLPVDTPRVAFLPAEADFSLPRWNSVPLDGMVVRPWLPTITPLQAGAMTYTRPATAWVAPVAVLREALRARPDHLGLHAVATSLERRGVPLGFLSAPAFDEGTGIPPSAEGPPRLHRGSRVLAIVPHHRCESWLGQCLRSLTRQTRPAQSIVVIDDASPVPPRDVVSAFPGVTLLCARENVGPFRLVQTVIDRTQFDAYMFQDADDWSADDRLALLLDGAETTGAELIGCQELRFDEPAGSVSAFCYVPNASRSLRTVQRYSILHPTSLVSRDLVMRAGGFATGLKFGGDLEFQLRAHHRGHVVNIGRYAYFRRRRDGSLWTSSETGRYSTVRQTQVTQIVEQARANAAAVALGRAPDLQPFRHAGPIALEHSLGPALF
jgi:hypothetical protein